MIPVPGLASLFIDNAFDPADYAGFLGDWLADNATVVAGNITAVASSAGAAGPLAPLGTVPYLATGWSDGTPAADFNNTSPRAFYAGSGLGGSTTWRTFHVISLDSIVPVAPSQAIAFHGRWGDGDVFGANVLRSFGDGFVYRQGVGVVDYLPLAVAGVQIWCFESVAGVFNVYRGLDLQLTGVTTETALNAITLCGFTTDGVSPSAASALIGPWKRSLAYGGAIGPDRVEITTQLQELYP